MLKDKKILSIFYIIVLIALTVLGYSRVDYNWQWYRVPQYLFTYENGRMIPGLLAEGLFVTLQISFMGLILALITGAVSAFARLSRFPVLRIFSWLYVELIRNTPLLIQIFFIYFVVSPVLDISAFYSALLALTLFEGAYASEIIRSGIINIPKGQFEAADSLGLPQRVVYTRIIIPQMLRQTLPMLAGQSVSLIKDSALVSTISIYDLTMQGQRIVSETFLTFEIWFSVALCYLIITAGLSLSIRKLEHKINYIQ